MNNDIGPQGQRPLVYQAGPGAVHDHDGSDGMRHGGYLFDVKNLVHAEVFSDELEQELRQRAREMAEGESYKLAEAFHREEILW